MERIDGCEPNQANGRGQPATLILEEQLEEFSGIVNEKLRKTEEENRIARLRTQMHHEQNKEEGYDLIKEYAEKLTAMKRRKLEIESLMLDEPAL
ncbi:hypothetical protein Peur_015569 [Populus x canadensis]